MPEDLEDRMIDFELMLEGFVANSEDQFQDSVIGGRLLSYWYELSEEFKKLMK